jgi:hypothetical protein
MDYHKNAAWTAVSRERLARLVIEDGYQGKTYDLSHLHPFEVWFERPAQDGTPPVRFRVEAHFSLHCFSRRLGDDPYDKSLIYPGVSEARLFDLYRYECRGGCRRLSGVC